MKNEDAEKLLDKLMIDEDQYIKMATNVQRKETDDKLGWFLVDIMEAITGVKKRMADLSKKDCRLCRHNPVCSYKDEYDKLFDKLTESCYDGTNDVLTIKVDCKYFDSDMAIRR